MSSVCRGRGATSHLIISCMSLARWLGVISSFYRRRRRRHGKTNDVGSSVGHNISLSQRRAASSMKGKTSPAKIAASIAIISSNKPTCCNIVAIDDSNCPAFSSSHATEKFVYVPWKTLSHNVDQCPPLQKIDSSTLCVLRSIVAVIWRLLSVFKPAALW